MMSSTTHGGAGIRGLVWATVAGLAVSATVSTARESGGPRRFPAAAAQPRPATQPAGAGLAEHGAAVRDDDADRQTARGGVLLVSTQGGHLAQLLALRSWYAGHDRLWVCPDTPDVADRLADERVVHSYTPTTRNIPNLLRNLALAVRVMRRERPAVVVSAGAGVAVPFFVIAWLMRVPTAFIEVFDRIDSPTMTGRLCGPFATRRIVQWKSQQEFYPESQLVGPLL